MSAGKTTAIRLLCGLLAPDAGQITLFGSRPTAAEAKSRLGYLSQRFSLYRDLTVEEMRVHCRTLLVNYKVPTSFRFLAEIPKNAVGKALRRELRAQAAEE